LKLEDADLAETPFPSRPSISGQDSFRQMEGENYFGIFRDRAAMIIRHQPSSVPPGLRG
jgi:hypothetical protein